jgi:hypothetical protein
MMGVSNHDAQAIISHREVCVLQPARFLQNDKPVLSVKIESSSVSSLPMGRDRAEFGRLTSPGLQLWRQEGDRPCCLDFSSNLHPGLAREVVTWRGLNSTPLSTDLLRNRPPPQNKITPSTLMAVLDYLMSTVWVDLRNIYTYTHARTHTHTHTHSHGNNSRTCVRVCEQRQSNLCPIYLYLYP